MKTKLRTTSECRDLRHSWHQIRGGNLTRNTYFRILACDRDCGAERHQELDAKGYVIREHHKYTDPTYLIKGGPMTKEEKAALRLMSLKH